MTKKSLHTNTCPLCNKTYEREVEDVLGEDSLEFVMSWEVFKQTCPHCKEDFLYKHPVIYTDNTKKFVVCYAPEITDFLYMLDEVAKEQLSDNGYIYRVVPAGHMRFIEKVGVLTVGLDDVVAEVYKEITYINLDNENIDNMLYEFNDTCTGFGLSAIHKDDHVDYYDVDFNTMESLYEDVKDRGVIGRFNDYVVNRKLAVKILYSEDDLTPLHIDMLKELNEE